MLINYFGICRGWLGELSWDCQDFARISEVALPWNQSDLCQQPGHSHLVRDLREHTHDWQSQTMVSIASCSFFILPQGFNCQGCFQYRSSICYLKKRILSTHRSCPMIDNSCFSIDCFVLGNYGACKRARIAEAWIWSRLGRSSSLFSCLGAAWSCRPRWTTIAVHRKSEWCSPTPVKSEFFGAQLTWFVCLFLRICFRMQCRPLLQRICQLPRKSAQLYWHLLVP